MTIAACTKKPTRDLNRGVCLLLLPIALVAATSLICSCSQTSAEKTEAPKIAAEEKQVFEVPIVITERGSLAENLTIPGAVAPLPDHSVKISPAISGKLTEVLAVSGQSVVKGQVIAKLDDRHLREILEQSRSAVDLAKTAVKQAENNLTFARDNVDRQKRLFQAEVSAKKDIQSAENQVITAASQLEAAQSQLRSAHVQIKQNETELSLTQIHSPISGTVANRFLNAGDSSDPNTPILQIVDLQRVVINAQLPADSPAQVKVAERATIKGVGQTTGEWTGKVTSISPVVDPTSNTVRIQLECANREGGLRDGQTVSVAITNKINRDAILIPATALVPDPEDAKKEMVYRVDTDIAHRVPVTHAQSVGTSVEITSGLKAGEKIIASGAYGLPDGAKVKVRNASK